MTGLWIALVWLMLVSVSPALAEIYRWTDDAGKIHLTDNPDTIPPAYRARARASGAGPSPTDETPSVDARPSPPPLPAARLPATQAPAPSAAPTTSEIAELERQVAAARQERQTYLEQFSSEREVHANPLFVRQRRQIAELGYALLAVEQRLDTLQAALEQAQQQLQAPPPESSHIAFDRAGNDATYWQQRVGAVRERLQQAHMQRRDLLTQLAAATDGGQGIMGRQGYEMLQQAQALQQVEQEIDAAEAALQAMQQEALQAGAPRAWLQ